MVVNTSDNRYGVAQLIVAPTLAEGANYTTIASAISAASSGQTIFIRPGTYTENLTLKAGVNLVAFLGDDNTPNVTIVGTCTMTTAGTVSISNIRLQTNSAALLAVTGSAASIVNIDNCYLNITNNTGITFSSSSSSAAINIFDSLGNIGTTGIACFSHSSAGSMNFMQTEILNSGGSSTNSTASAGTLVYNYSRITFATTTSSTNFFGASYSLFDMGGNNVTPLTIGGSSGTQDVMNQCYVGSGTASAISIGGDLYIRDTIIVSSNTNAITGAGTLRYTGLSFGSSSSTMNTTTQVASFFRPGITLSAHQPAFLANNASDQLNVTGNGTVYTCAFGTEIFDQGSNFASNTFTAPYTGRYLLTANISTFNNTNAVTSSIVSIVTSNRTYGFAAYNEAPAIPFGVGNAILGRTVSILADMDAADTATITWTASGTTQTIDYGAGSYFSGYLVC